MIVVILTSVTLSISRNLTTRVMKLRIMDAQLPRSVSMLIKSFQVLCYDFLVVPSLDFMLEDKSSQKLMVPGVPFIENVDISVKKQDFVTFITILCGCHRVKCVPLAFDLI